MALHCPWSVPLEDEVFAQPFIDVDEWRDTPLRHRYVHGGFDGTDTRFSFYFPPPERYQGRFFQHITPVPDSEHLAQGATGEEDRISFCVESGAYFVETNGGGQGAAAMLNPDPSIGAYRANAACAQYSREVALAIFGGARPYGYAYGGSGGAFRTIGGAENTSGVWDGVVPYVNGSPVAIPNVFTVRMRALRVLRDRFPEIVDAFDAGGAGADSVPLTDEQRDVLLEVTAMGFPPRSWFGYKTMGPHGFAMLFHGIVAIDPQYFDDFWTVPGYLGADDPASLAGDRIHHDTTVAAAIDAAEAQQLGANLGDRAGRPRGNVDDAWQALGEGDGSAIPVGFRLATVPDARDFTLAELIVSSGQAAGARFSVASALGDIVLVNSTDPKLSIVAPGDAVRLDNDRFLASQTLHRHQDPGPEYPVWNQFRNADGTPRYLQRPMLLGPRFTVGASGTVPSGRFGGKMILVASLLDREAYPWQADWYRQKATEYHRAEVDDRFRLWFTDNALHGDLERQEDPTRTVSYLGILHQALRDLSAWVEKGVEPAPTTQYRVVDGQVLVPERAGDRKGIQPVVTLTANGAERAEVAVGDPVVLTATTEVPPGTGRIVTLSWDLDGENGALVAEDLSTVGDREHLVTETTHFFAAPGTYFPVVHVTAHRTGEPSVFARLHNLARVRVVVR